MRRTLPISRSIKNQWDRLHRGDREPFPLDESAGVAALRPRRFRQSRSGASSDWLRGCGRDMPRIDQRRIPFLIHGSIRTVNGKGSIDGWAGCGSLLDSHASHRRSKATRDQRDAARLAMVDACDQRSPRSNLLVQRELLEQMRGIQRFASEACDHQDFRPIRP